MTALASALVCERDGPLAVPSSRWVDRATDADLSVIARTLGPALDVGCGPGRHVVALAERGICVLGIDVTPEALARAHAKGAVVLERSVFDRVPGAGRWACALLLDGNIGIGGDPVALLARVASLIRSNGCILVELDAPGTTPAARTVRFDLAGKPGPWFALTQVATDAIEPISAQAGLVVTDRWSLEGRWFASLAVAPS